MREISVGPLHNLSGDGRWLVADGLAVWPSGTSQRTPPPTELTKPASPVLDVAINSRGAVVAGKADVFVWQLPNHAPKACRTAESIQSLAVSRDGNEVAGREAGGRFRRRNAISGKPRHDEAQFTRLAGSRQYSPNNRFVLVSRSDGVRVFDTSINQRGVLSGPRAEGSSEVTALGSGRGRTGRPPANPMVPSGCGRSHSGNRTASWRPAR